MNRPPAWRELAPGVHVAVVEPETVTIGLVVGRDAALVVDTGSTPHDGRVIRESAAARSAVPLYGAVVTHWHYDHAFGLAAFADLTTIGHESVADRLASTQAVRAAHDVAVTGELAPPSQPIAVARSIDLGGRRVEIAHLGRGHTDGDLVVVVPDADVVFTGDLVESSGPPWYGDDSFPLEWAGTLDGLVGLMTERTRAVPGHGPEVGREAVFEARGQVAAVATELTRLAHSGVLEQDALTAGTWAFPAANIAGGVSAGYAQLRAAGLSPARRQLPLA
jgi:glyoxylase-like metal-dependent hydrolase (beta-lactamase superfamily II)